MKGLAGENDLAGAEAEHASEGVRLYVAAAIWPRVVPALGIWQQSYVGCAVVCNPPALIQDLLRVDRADRYALQSRGGVFGMQELQEKVQDKVGLAPSQQLLTFQSKPLSNYPSRTLADFNIQAEDTLYLSGRLCGD